MMVNGLWMIKQKPGMGNGGFTRCPLSFALDGSLTVSPRLWSGLPSSLKLVIALEILSFSRSLLVS